MAVGVVVVSASLRFEAYRPHPPVTSIPRPDKAPTKLGYAPAGGQHFPLRLFLLRGGKIRQCFQNVKHIRQPRRSNLNIAYYWERIPCPEYRAVCEFHPT